MSNWLIWRQIYLNVMMDEQFNGLLDYLSQNEEKIFRELDA